MLLSVALYLFGLLFRGKMKILVTTVVLRARALLSTTYLLFTYLQQTTIPNGWVGGGVMLLILILFTLTLAPYPTDLNYGARQMLISSVFFRFNE